MGNIERIGVAKCSMNLPSDTTAISSSTEFSDMAVEMHRLISFGTWPHKNEFPQPSALGSAGFYYTGEADKTKCFSCEGEVLNWRSDMYPDEIHRTRFPDCLLVKGEETRHKPMQPSAEGVKNDETVFRKKLKELSFIYRDSTIALQSSNPHGMTNPVLVKHRQSRVATGSPGSLMPLSSPASVTPAVDYTDEQVRLRSFAHWSKSNVMQPSNLAWVGMYFIGSGDRVQCAFWKGKLEGWIRGDNPLHERNIVNTLVWDVTSYSAHMWPLTMRWVQQCLVQAVDTCNMLMLKTFMISCTVIVNCSREDERSSTFIGFVFSQQHATLYGIQNSFQENLSAAEQGNHNAGFQPACYPMYADEDRRLKTFRKETEEVRDEAKAGFFCESKHLL